MSIFKEVNINNPGTSVKHGADDLDLVSKLFNGVIAGIPPVKIKSQNKFGVWDALFFIRNQSDTRNTTIRGQSNTPATDVELRLPPITANDTLPAIGLVNVWGVRQQMEAGLLFKQMTQPSNPAASYHHLFVDSISGHLKKINSSGVVVDYDVSVSIPSFFPSGALRIQNPAQSFYYNIIASAITADRNLTLPLITGPDTVAVLGLGQTFTGNNTFSGTTTFSGPVNLSGAVTYGDDDLQIFNPAGTFKYTFSTSAITADWTVTLPLLTANGTFAIAEFQNVWTSNQLMNNNLNWQIKDSGGTGRQVVKINASNAFILGDSAGIVNIDIFSGNASNPAFRINSSNVVTISPEWSVAVVVNNNVGLSAKTIGGTVVGLVSINTSDHANFGSTSTAITSWRGYSGNANAFLIADNNSQVTWQKAAQASVAETLAEWRVLDSAGTSYIRLANFSATDAVFAPRLIFNNSDSADQIELLAQVAPAFDTGTAPVFDITSRRNDNTSITTRPLFRVNNRGTEIFKINANGNSVLTVLAQAGVTESLMDFKVSDNAGFIRLTNNTTTDGAFGGQMDVTLAAGSTASTVAMIYVHRILAANDTGSNAVVSQQVKTTVFGDITTRPLWTWVNNATEVMRINHDGDVLHTIIAQASPAEILDKWVVSDAPNSYLQIENNTTTDLILSPRIIGYNANSASYEAISLYGQILSTLDTGSVAAVKIIARLNTIAALTTRPVLEIFNNTTSILEVSAKGKFTHIYQDEGSEETMVDITLSDGGASYYRIGNAVGGVASSYVPRVWGHNALTNTSFSGLYIYGSILSGQDTGTVGAISLDGRVGTGGVMGTRPMVTIRNASTIVYSFYPGQVDLGNKLLNKVYGVQQEVTQRYVSMLIPPTISYRGSGAFNEGSNTTGTVSTSNDASGGFVRVTAAASVDALAQYVSATTVTTRSSNPKWMWAGSFDSMTDVRFKMGFCTASSFAVGATTIAGANAGFAVRFIAGTDTTLQLVTNDALGGAEQVLDMGFTPAAATGYCIELYFDTGASTVTATIYNYTTGAVLGTAQATTQIPTTSHNLFRVCRSENITTTAKAFVTRWEKLYKNGTGPALPF